MSSVVNCVSYEAGRRRSEIDLAEACPAESNGSFIWVGLHAPDKDLLRTVRSYQLEVRDGWEPPSELHATGLRRSSGGRVVQCTLVGEEREVSQRLAAAGAHVRHVSALSLEDAALAFLPEDPS